MRGRLVAAAAVAALLLLVGSGSAASRVGTFTGYAFDACTAPSTTALTAWQASPYRGLGIYLGGVNRACKDGKATRAEVRRQIKKTRIAASASLLGLPVGFDRHGDMIKKPFGIYHSVKGVFVRVA